MNALSYSAQPSATGTRPLPAWDAGCAASRDFRVARGWKPQGAKLCTLPLRSVTWSPAWIVAPSPTPWTQDRWNRPTGVTTNSASDGSLPGAAGAALAVAVSPAAGPAASSSLATAHAGTTAAHARVNTPAAICRDKIEVLNPDVMDTLLCG